MKTRVLIGKPKKNKYPKLMISSNKKSIIIATGEVNATFIRGMLIWSSTDYHPEIGEVKDWMTISFDDFSGSVTLSND